MTDWAEQHLHLISKGMGHDVDTLRDQVTGLSDLVNDMLRALQLTEAEQRALDASAELANAMRAIMPGIGQGSGLADHDWNEVCRSVHDVQARIMAIAASRTGLPCRPLGATEEATAEWVQLVRTTEPL